MSTSTSRPTSDPDQIRLWAASQNAMPAELLPGMVDAEPPQLHFFIPGQPEAQTRLRMIGWEDFFAAFKAHNLLFVYEILADGRPGRRFEIMQAEETKPGASPRREPTHDSDTAVPTA